MIVGIDVGTQSLKAIVVEADTLRERGAAAFGYATRHPQPLHAEQDPRDWERALGPALAGALAAARASPGDVAALGLTGQLDGCVPVDEAGAAAAPCLIWMDRRAAAELSEDRAARVRAITGLVPDASHLAAKIAWLKRHHPDAARFARFHQPVSYLVARLTGAQVWDRALASTSMLLALGASEPDAGLLDAFGIAAHELPAVADAEAPAGALTGDGAALTGLRRGIPVSVGTGDDFAGMLGAGIATPGRVVASLGTAEVIGTLLRAPVIDAGGLLETHAWDAASWMLENPGWLAGGAIAWLGELLGGVDAAGIDALAAAAPPGADGLTFLPALAGAMAPEWNAGAHAAWYGLSAAHGRAHLARSVFEGCAFAMRDVVGRMDALAGPLAAVRLVGGGARSPIWPQIRADATRLPVEVGSRLDVAPLGAAMLAAIAAGRIADRAGAAARLPAPARRVEPDAVGAERMDAAYARYRLLFESLRPMFAA